MGSVSEPLYWRLQILNDHKCLSDKSWKRRRLHQVLSDWVVVLGSVTNASDLLYNFNIQAPAPFRIHNKLVNTKYVLAGSLYPSLVLDPGCLHWLASLGVWPSCVSTLILYRDSALIPTQACCLISNFYITNTEASNFFIPQFAKSMIMYYLTPQKRWEKFSSEFLS